MDKVDNTEKHVSFPLDPVTKYDEESNHFPSNPVTKNYEEFDRHRKKRSSLCSTSSGSEYLEECSISSHPESFSSISSDDYNNEKVYVPEFYEIEMIFWTKNDGDEDMCELGEWKQVIGRHTQSERITLDCSVFGQEIDHLLPIKSKTRPELQHEFHQIQARIGLPFDKNGNPAPSAALGRQTISAVFGCNEFPSDFMGKTLKAWTENSKTLEFISISWRIPVKNREEEVTKMAQNYDLQLTHVWKFSKHQESMYALAYFDEEEEQIQKAKEDSVNMYILHPKYENHTAILSVSDYALTLHCAFTQGKEAVPILKQAFNNATQIKDTFYEIHSDRINKEEHLMVNATVFNYLKALSSRFEKSNKDLISPKEEENVRAEYRKHIARKIVELIGIHPEEIDLWHDNDIVLSTLVAKLNALATKFRLNGLSVSSFSSKVLTAYQENPQLCKRIISSVSPETIKKIVIYLTAGEVNAYWDHITKLSKERSNLQRKQGEKKKMFIMGLPKGEIKSKIDGIKKEIEEIKNEIDRLEALKKPFETKIDNKWIEFAHALCVEWRDKDTRNDERPISLDFLTEFPVLQECFKERHMYSNKDLELIEVYKRHRFRTMFFESVKTTLINHNISHGRTAVSVLNGIEAILQKLLQISDLNMERLIAFLLKTSNPQIGLKQFIMNNAYLEELPQKIPNKMLIAFGIEELRNLQQRIVLINKNSKYKWMQANSFLWAILTTNGFVDIATECFKNEDKHKALLLLQDDTFLTNFQRNLCHIIDDHRKSETSTNKIVYYDRRYRTAVITETDRNGNAYIVHYRQVWQKGQPEASDFMKHRELDISKHISYMYADLRKYGEHFMKTGLDIASIPELTLPIRSRFVKNRLGEQLRNHIFYYCRVRGKILTFKSVDKFVHHVAKHPQSKIYPNFNPKSLFTTFCKKGGEWIVSAPTVNFIVKQYGIIVYLHNGSGLREYFSNSTGSIKQRRKRRRSRRSKDADSLPYMKKGTDIVEETKKTPLKKLAVLISETGEMTVNTFF